MENEKNGTFLGTVYVIYLLVEAAEAFNMTITARNISRF